MRKKNYWLTCLYAGFLYPWEFLSDMMQLRTYKYSVSFKLLTLFFDRKHKYYVQKHLLIFLRHYL